MRVDSYPSNIHLKPPPRAAVPPPAPTTLQVMADWLKQTAGSLSTTVAKMTTPRGG